MPVARIHKTKDYTVMSNYHFREKEMSLKAKGLLSLMLSLPDDWDYSIAGLVTLSKDGKDSVMNALNELEEFGYLMRTKVTAKNGQFAGYDYDIYEQPFMNRPITENPNAEKPEAENPDSEKPYAENPNTENPQQLNTKELNTKELITKKTNTKESNINLHKEIIDYLNKAAGTKFKHTTKVNQQNINGRFHEGFTLEDFKVVIDKKCAEWIGTEFEKYLRPSTLFGSKFEGYLNAHVKASKKYGSTGIEIKEAQQDDDDLAGIL